MKAGELVTHGLLEFYHSGDRDRSAERVSRVLEALPVGRDTSRSYRFPRRRVFRWSLAIAALVALCTTAMFVGIPGESSARAEVRRTIRAMKNPGNRRYEVTLYFVPAGTPPEGVNAIIDTRSQDLLLIQHKPPWAKGFVAAGRDGQGTWAVTPEGTISRDRPERYWPPFVTDGGETFIMHSMDDLLAALPTLFAFKRLPQEALVGGGRRLFNRITAERKDREGRRPHTVELWIDPASNLAERFEYHWDEGAGPGKDDQVKLHMVVFQRVDAPIFPTDWFTPEAHKAE